FLGREFGSRREVSEQTAELVDTEVKRLLDEAVSRARHLLTEHRDLLERITAALLERETIDRDDLDLLVRDQPLPPRPPAVVPTTPSGPPTAKVQAATARPPILGAPPAEPAGA
ncbi:MAG: cell division protein FtsH, partial [Gemmatimonadales bacterium]